METEPAHPLHPDMLPPGTVVGPWRVVEWAGRGVHGAVYRALSVTDAAAPPVALKLALVSGDSRFAREVALLSRLSHPSIPRMVDSGVWQPPGGPPYSYVAMQWVSGAPLYEWARQHPPSSSQVPRLLAQLARALEAVHAQGAVHRDVKGGNVMVRRSDSRAFLTDFGSGNLPGAAVLTPPFLQPGTPIYRSPESWLFALSLGRDALVPYAAQPTDDLFALGVTACQLLTGKYPALSDPYRDDDGIWHLEAVIVPPSLQRVEPLLRDCILRMLSVGPEQRGTASELAKALEQAERHVAAATPQSWPKRPLASPRPGALSSSLVTMAAGVTLALWSWWVAPNPYTLEPPPAEPTAKRASQPDAGTQGLGESVAKASAQETFAPSTPVMAEDTLPEPLEGQVTPDAKGRCPYRQQVALNGGCWVPQSQDREECAALSGQVFKGSCYVPIIKPRTRRPNSGPTPR